MPETIKQVVDGFSYNTSLTYVQSRYFPNALTQLDVLRRAVNYRPRWWCVPDAKTNPIDPYDTLYQEIEVAGNSWLRGYMFASVSATDSDDAPAETAASDILIQVVDTCSGIPLFMDYANGGGCHSTGAARMFPILLSSPRLILDPALLNVQISNRTANTITCQLLLFFAESCKAVTEESRDRDWNLIQQSQQGVGR